MTSHLYRVLIPLLVFCLVISSPVFAMTGEPQQIRIIPPQSKADASHHYFQQLLERALQLTEVRYGAAEVVFAPHVIEQGRAVENLNEGKWIDVYWMGTSIEREKDLNAIRIPLVKGLLGYRGFIMTARLQRSFDVVSDRASVLKSLSACQGMHWPDSDILEQGGFKVVRSARYDTLFAMLKRNRCDIFPRGVHEGPAEVANQVGQGAGISWEDNALIYYPFPMYFFTSRSNPELAERIREGLERMIDDGSFEEFMRHHEVTQHLFPLEQWPGKVSVRLTNPELPADTDYLNPRYWVVP
ncbi:amino acid ABC transporter substrate-binding protein [Oceanospirillum sanctuarii]|uniref:amino acid ABC transporter substrate-binding protein n=1 Tax=Oceanospirillum sanctuarii TaxID=1434821 RepID=UPI00111D7512|nr:amino acid ABC transporter substrate-binding protein [Oceanospirillum sanctuarii]